MVKRIYIIFRWLAFCVLIGALSAFCLLIFAPKSRDSSFQKAKDSAENIYETDVSRLEIVNMRIHLKELKRIETSIGSELQELENRRRYLLSNISSYNSQIDRVRTEFLSLMQDLEKLKVSIFQAELEKRDVSVRRLPVLANPLPPRASGRFENAYHHLFSLNDFMRCTMARCFNLSLCSLVSEFLVYIYDPYRYHIGSISSAILEELYFAANQTNFRTFSPQKACLFMAFSGPSLDEDDDPADLLPFWNNGTNHILVYIQSSLNYDDNTIKLLQRNIYTSSSLSRTQRLSEKFDMPISLPFSFFDLKYKFDDLPYLVPAVRFYLICFSASWSRNSSLNSLDKAIVRVLTNLQRENRDRFHINIHVSQTNPTQASNMSEWVYASDVPLRDSTFSLLISPDYFSPQFWMQLLRSLCAGAVPVILYDDFLRLPFDEALDWQNVAVILPKHRVTELHFYLRSLLDEHILEYRRKGRFFLTTYLGKTKNWLNTIVLSVRERIQIAPSPLHPVDYPDYFASNRMLLSEENQSDVDVDEILGPIEPPIASPSFVNNLTATRMMHRFSSNWLISRFYLYPSYPFGDILPTDAQFIGSTFGFRPIGGGLGGSGKEFSQALGGNMPREQFTIVMLTFEREAVLVNSLQRFRGLPYLNKIIVVWNGRNPPSPELKWPDIGVKIYVARMDHNSLNNRFLPFSAIETDAILSIDDDSHLRHDEIIFGFRVWRQERERIVGFPSRFHTWNSTFFYDSNYSCELSMVLTGAAFLHRFYLYHYTYEMPEQIRSKVDEFINCEDIAMNFLVSHLTRKPPIKVTSRWTFRCAGCPQSLWTDDEHFRERHKCIDFFSQVYGYNPLLYSQYRVDSVLFKTRLPHDKQKCFRFI